MKKEIWRRNLGGNIETIKRESDAGCRRFYWVGKKNSRIGHMKRKLVRLEVVFCTLIGVAVLTVGVMVVPVLRECLIGLPFLIISGGALVLLGVALVFLTMRAKRKGWPKGFLILTGASAVGFLPAAFLHNFLYALTVLASEIVALHDLLEVFHVVFFIIATLVCPLGFLIGLVGSLVMLITQKPLFS